MKKVKVDIRDKVAGAMEWPSIKETADDWDLPERTVRSIVERGRVESIHLDRIRINPDSFAEYIESQYQPGHMARH